MSLSLIRIFISIIYIENRSSADNNQSIIGNFNPIITQPHYSPLAYLNKPSSSSDTSHIWNPIDSLNSSFSSTSSNSDYNSISSLYGSETKSNSNLTTTTEDFSMIYNPNHRMIKEEEQDIKRELSPQLNGTPPPKKRPRSDAISTLPTPPPSSDFSSATAKIMVRKLLDYEIENFDVLFPFRQEWVMIKIVVLVLMLKVQRN
jgi:hypothetical protein